MVHTRSFIHSAGIASVGLLLTWPMKLEAGCETDMECKGDRICEGGICVDPANSGTTDTVSSTHASTTPTDLAEKLRQIADDAVHALASAGWNIWYYPNQPFWGMNSNRPWHDAFVVADIQAEASSGLVKKYTRKHPDYNLSQPGLQKKTGWLVHCPIDCSSLTNFTKTYEGSTQLNPRLTLHYTSALPKLVADTGPVTGVGRTDPGIAGQCTLSAPSIYRGLGGPDCKMPRGLVDAVVDAARSNDPTATVNALIPPEYQSEKCQRTVTFDEAMEATGILFDPIIREIAEYCGL